MKLLRYGPAGAEKPGLLDGEGRVRDLSAHVADIAGAVLEPEGLARLAALEGAVEADPAEGAVAAELLGILDAGGGLGEPDLRLLRLAGGQLFRSFDRGKSSRGLL